MTDRHRAAAIHAALGKRQWIATGQAAHRADARTAKAFIRSYGPLGKSDALDAKALARYGTVRHDLLARWQAPDPNRSQPQALGGTDKFRSAPRVRGDDDVAALELGDRVSIRAPV